MTIKKITCARCQGKGLVPVYTPHIKNPDYKPCPECGGIGQIAVMVPGSAPWPPSTIEEESK